MTSRKHLRIDWIDIAKGLGIILVVLGHTERGLGSSGIAPESWKYGLDFYLYTFHMPLFMFLSGLNVPHSLRAGRREFLMRKLPTIVWPYLLWSLIIGAVGTLLSSLTNNPGDWGDFAKIAWRPISPFWFLYALFVYCVVLAITGLRAVVLVPLSFLAFGVGLMFANDTLIQQLLHFLIFFVAGALLAPRLLGANREPAWWLVVAVTIAWFAVTAAVGAPSDHRYFSAWGLPSALLGISFMILLAIKTKGLPSSVLAELGRASMPIYVMHILATAGTRIVLSRLHLTDSPLVYVVACTTAGVLGPYVGYLILRRLRWLPAFGFGRNLPQSTRALAPTGAAAG